jgi:Raf kinase inhibitor-like YbhB/YbcL family protein
MSGKISPRIVATALAMFFCASISGAAENQKAKPHSVAALGVVSGFQNGQPIPRVYTGDGADESPPLRWTPAPANAKSIAIICFDPDAPRGTWYHWLLYNLSPKLTSLSGNVRKTDSIEGGASQGINDFKHVGYNGPSPPPGAKHRYYYRVMALDQKLSVPPGADKEKIIAALKAHIIAQGETMGVFSH